MSRVGVNGRFYQTAQTARAEQGVAGDKGATGAVEITAAVPRMPGGVNGFPVVKPRWALAVFENIAGLVQWRGGGRSVIAVSADHAGL